MELGFAALHQLLVPFLTRIGELLAPQKVHGCSCGRRGGLDASPAADRSPITPASQPSQA
jgi:hypothetical protein